MWLDTRYRGHKSPDIVQLRCDEYLKKNGNFLTSLANKVSHDLGLLLATRLPINKSQHHSPKTFNRKKCRTPVKECSSGTFRTVNATNSGCNQSSFGLASELSQKYGESGRRGCHLRATYMSVHMILLITISPTEVLHKSRML